MAKPGFGFLRPLPNEGSPHRTPASIIYDLHWANLRLVERWDWARFARLSTFLRHTPYELGSLVMMSHQAVDSLRRYNNIRTHGARQVALTLTLLEAHLLAGWRNDIIENPFPSIHSSEGSGASSGSTASEAPTSHGQ
jgi:hypothetical protein